MCVGIPRKIIEISNPENNLAMIEVNGVKHEINIAPIVEADRPVDSCVGDWALIHMGFAMRRIDEAEATKILELLRELGEVQLQMDVTLRNKQE